MLCIGFQLIFLIYKLSAAISLHIQVKNLLSFPCGNSVGRLKLLPAKAIVGEIWCR